MERVLERNSREYQNLLTAAKLLSALDENGFYYELRDVYLDFGANWMWTTIIKVNPAETGILRSCQILNSKQWRGIIEADTKKEILEAIKDLLN